MLNGAFFYWHRSGKAHLLLDDPKHALGLWLYIGIYFGFVYWLIDEWGDKDALYGIRGPMDYFYFSFIALATVGFGDIHPAHSYSKIAAVIESTLGLITVVFIAMTTTKRVDRNTSICQLLELLTNCEAEVVDYETQVVPRLVIILSGPEFVIEGISVILSVEQRYFSEFDPPEGSYVNTIDVSGTNIKIDNARKIIEVDFNRKEFRQHPYGVGENVDLLLRYSIRSHAREIRCKLKAGHIDRLTSNSIGDPYKKKYNRSEYTSI